MTTRHVNNEGNQMSSGGKNNRVVNLASGWLCLAVGGLNWWNIAGAGVTFWRVAPAITITIIGVVLLIFGYGSSQNGQPGNSHNSI